jgi:hypothetical protein
MRVKSTKIHPEPRTPFASAVPPTIAEQAAASERWEFAGRSRRGILRQFSRCSQVALLHSDPMRKECPWR